MKIVLLVAQNFSAEIMSWNAFQKNMLLIAHFFALFMSENSFLKKVLLIAQNIFVSESTGNKAERSNSRPGSA